MIKYSLLKLVVVVLIAKEMKVQYFTCEELSLSQSYSTLSIEMGTFKDERAVPELTHSSSPSSQSVPCSFFWVVNRFLAQTYPNTHQQISHTQKLLLALSLSWQWHWQDHALRPSPSLGHLICDTHPQGPAEQQNYCAAPKQGCSKWRIRGQRKSWN